VMLEPEFDARLEREVGRRTSKTPDYGTCCAVDFIDRRRVSA
jgi:hypothetical protein